MTEALTRRRRGCWCRRGGRRNRGLSTVSIPARSRTTEAQSGGRIIPCLCVDEYLPDATMQDSIEQQMTGGKHVSWRASNTGSHGAEGIHREVLLPRAR